MTTLNPNTVPGPTMVEDVINNPTAEPANAPAFSAQVKKVLQTTMQTGLTGCQILIAAADAPVYASLVADYQKQFRPVGPEEIALVQSIIDLRWRLNRLPGLESALLDLGRRKLLRQEPALAGNPAPALEMQVRLNLDKEFRNLRSEERTLARRREREMQELTALQAARKAEETKAKEAIAPAAKAENGFVFSTSQLVQFLGTLTPPEQQNFMLEVIRSMPETGQPDETKQAVA